MTPLYYAGVLLSASATLPRAKPDSDLSAPASQELSRALRDGWLVEGAPETVHLLGKIFLSSFLTGRPVPPLTDIEIFA